MSVNVVTRVKPQYLTAAEELRDNPGQWNAYEFTGNCVIQAGPGTKTLTIKMARIAAQDIVTPRGIACICAAELRRRLDQLGVREAKNLFVGTIRSISLKNVLLPYARMAGLGLPDEISVAAPSEQDKFFERAVDKTFGLGARPESWRTSFDRYPRTYLNHESNEWRQVDADTANVSHNENVLPKSHLP